jgi:hypothetical protein
MMATPYMIVAIFSSWGLSVVSNRIHEGVLNGDEYLEGLH